MIQIDQVADDTFAVWCPFCGTMNHASQEQVDGVDPLFCDDQDRKYYIKDTQQVRRWRGEIDER